MGVNTRWRDNFLLSSGRGTGARYDHGGEVPSNNTGQWLRGITAGTPDMFSTPKADLANC
jgi:hypothetical protein